MRLFRPICPKGPWLADTARTPQPAKWTCGSFNLSVRLVLVLGLIGTTGLVSTSPTAFAQSTGSLTVTLGPVDILPAEARWQVDGGTWQKSGATVAGLSAGNHTVVCLPVDGWITPASRDLVLGAGQSLQDRTSYRQLLVPDGVYFGIGFDWAVDSVDSVVKRFGRAPAVYVRFVEFPENKGDRYTIDSLIGMINEHNGILLLTLEPYDGLSSITTQQVEDFAKWIAKHNREGTQIFIRFGHEMNGAWYPWCQRPTEYRMAFQMLANAVHYYAPRSYMLWAPNYGDGYPFGHLPYAAKPGTVEFTELDTNHDGSLTQDDDCYGPFYPGDDFVDWVGMSAYHWGGKYPWEENEIAEADKFAAIITGEYNGANGDSTNIPDFYEEYAAGRNKPMAIVETSAFYNTTRPDEASELAIKQNWWRQVFNQDIRNRFPQIMMINWFNYPKNESEIGDDLIDWSLCHNPQVLEAFLADLPTYDWLLFGTDVIRPSTYKDTSIKPGCAPGMNGALVMAMGIGLMGLKLLFSRRSS